MKGTRYVCAEKKSETKTSEELGDVVVGCKKTPTSSSIYCKKHANTVTKENPSNEDVKCLDEQVDDLRCNTRKDICLVKKNKTSGICAAVYNCGIIVGVTELFGCESLSQVYMFLVWLAKEMLNFPHLLAYDDACHLTKFVNNPIKADKTEYSKLLATIIMVVDKMHFVNHIDKWCRKNVNPYTDDQFKDINTEACEQTFNFIAKFKYATKHMSYAKYNIFMLYICTKYNIDRLVRNTKRCKFDL